MAPTDWWNRGGGGAPKWETFHLAELRQILERGYRAGPDRAVAGSSTGGLGALAYAARHRGLFRAAASFSGPVHTLHRDPCGLDVADPTSSASCGGSTTPTTWPAGSPASACTSAPATAPPAPTTRARRRTCWRPWPARCPGSSPASWEGSASRSRRTSTGAPTPRPTAA
ncbi:hypothetical protein HGB48_24795 [Actinomadura latina]|uniref:Esterase n=1 Tax=Actinomadura latina TaxID=163603 RepID=A0A846Z3V4_9ACTN|nr:hypothetical protein [Actinomadura latina]